MKLVKRKSKQRDRLFELIKSSSEHPASQWIYAQLRQKFAKVSIGNFHRNSITSHTIQFFGICEKCKKG